MKNNHLQSVSEESKKIKKSARAHKHLLHESRRVCVCEGESVCVCVCVYLSVFIHGRERIGHAQLVVASVGVRPASVPLSFHREHINVWATSPPTGNSIRALLCFVSPSRGRGERKRASFCASLNLHNYTVDNLSDIYRLLLLRNPTRLLRRLWPLIGIPEPLASSQTPQHIPGRSPDQGRGPSRIFFYLFIFCVCFKSSLAWLLFFFLENQVLCWARLSRSRDKYTISPPTFVRPRPPPPPRYDHRAPRQCILTRW